MAPRAELGKLGQASQAMAWATNAKGPAAVVRGIPPSVVTGVPEMWLPAGWHAKPHAAPAAA